MYRQDAPNIPESALGFHGGRVKVDQQQKQYDFEIKEAKVFVTCKPLQSRFRKLFLPRYTEQQFLDVSQKVLPELSSLSKKSL